jgi:predicted dehydrogenase
MAALAIIGGGRWARSIAEVLSRLPAAPRDIVLHSPRNAEGVLHWIGQKGLGDRLGVSKTMPDLRAEKPYAAIVANRVCDHAEISMSLLDAGIPTLVEKPMVIGAELVDRLQRRARSSGTMLAASHVLLFARYLETFMSAVESQGTVLSLDALWEDGAGDTVRGEVKSYDAAVALFDDVLPHILPVLERLARHPLKFVSVALENGGAQVAIIADAGGVRVTIRLARNAAGRRRGFSVVTANGPFVLDFSSEPGMVLPPGLQGYSGDPLWLSGPRPLGAMLAAFLEGVGSGKLDPRLEVDLALASAHFADGVRASYQDQQQAWLASSGAAKSAARDYALRETSGRSA